MLSIHRDDKRGGRNAITLSFIAPPFVRGGGRGGAVTILCDRSGPASVGLPAVPAGTVLRTYNVHRKWGTKGKENIIIVNTKANEKVNMPQIIMLFR